MNTHNHTHVLLIGGGHSHWLVLEHLRKHPQSEISITLVSDTYRPFYSGLVPGIIGGAYQEKEAQIDLGLLCTLAAVRFVHKRVVGLDAQAKQVFLEGSPPLSYDILSLDVGISHQDREGVRAEVGRTKPSESLMEWNCRLTAAMKGKEDALVAIIGAGAAGVELALQLSSRYPRLRLHLIYRSKRILPDHTPVAARIALKLLRERGVHIHPASTGRTVSDGVLLDEETFLAADFVLNATGARPQSWIAQTELLTNDEGFILVSKTLQSLSHPNIFASGDVAMVKGNPYPRAGVFAIRQGPILAHNLLALAQDRSLREYTPQKRYLSLIGADTQSALAVYGRYALYAPWLWRLKEWIDIRFTKRFS